MATRLLADVPELILDAEGSDRRYWRDIAEFRELFYFLAWRDIVIRYKQTLIGIGWAILQPLLTMLIFTVVFGRIARLPSPDAPYPLLVLSGVLAWQYVSQAVSAASVSLVGNSNLVSKVYFPRILIPASAIGVSIVDFGIAFLLLLAMMIFYAFPPSLNLLALPLFLIVGTAVALGLGIWLSALSVKYRDVRFAVPFAIQLGLFISPVGFGMNAIPGQWRFLYSLNPMVGVIEGFRWSIIGGHTAFPLEALVVAILVAAFILLTGVRYFRLTERTLADVI